MKSFSKLYKNSLNKVSGIAAAPGIVIGQVYLFTKEKLDINKGEITNVDEAIKNFNEALNKSKKELQKIFAMAREKMDEARASIFEAQMMILDDPVLLQKIIYRIEKELRQPEYIVHDEISKYQELMVLSNESYMKDRAHDIDDIKNRIIRNLQKKRLQSKIKHDVIVVSDSLTPADALLLSRNNVKGFVTDHGGITSHAAIVSRSLNIPAVVGTHNATEILKDDQTIIVDGFHGYIIFDPSEEQINFFSQKISRLLKLQEELIDLKELPAETLDGKEIKLMANVDVSGEIDLVVTTGANGIGLYRTEQILDELGEFPTEDEQTEIYSKLASRIYPETLIIRTFDIGGDKFKFLDFVEPNPFLGLRGIRLLLENLSLFKTQLRAILRASKNKNIQVMLPMISTIEEIWKSKEIITDCKKELKAAKIHFDNHIKVGIMVEVPSAAVMSKEFSEEVDFVSIGTNDLIQYLMAVDRGNDLVSNLYQEFNPVVIRTIQHIVKETKKNHKSVSVCGEMAADTLAIPLLIGLGLDSLSISPSTILYAKRIIRSCDYKKTKELAEECLTLRTQEEIISKLENFFTENNITRTRQII
ncbi:MAG TPA: phosphoenolpyruvate--protein phosphotransferase [Ignavibacteriaceae bacterium]|nr:phosphoenolpyruvate--protein phosphotransferase [Ignavibacteriaceae bacterium]